MSITHCSRAANPRDLQTASHGSHELARSHAEALQDAGIACAIYQFPEFQGNWWAVCVDRKSQLAKAMLITRGFAAGMRAAHR